MNRRGALKTLFLGAGVSMSSSSALSLFNQALAMSDGPWKATFFESAQIAVIRRMSHIILPKSEQLPGAEDVPIVEFIDAIYAHMTDPRAQQAFIQGMDVFQAEFTKRYNGLFIAGSQNQQQAFLESLYNVSDTQKNDLLNLIDKPTPPTDDKDQYYLYSFLFSVRQLTLEGYFQSELVGEQVLAYDPIPGGYDGDYDIDSNTRAWSI